VLRYLKGEELAVENIEDGWTLVTVDHLSLGWGKVSKGRLKNHYPKGLRLI
jgi:NOL1/NOP2/fmu family ribosome biogenesis protein